MAGDGLRRARTVRLRRPNLGFNNPYPWMSDIEAMVHLDLERRQVPFSWRFFDGDAPSFTKLASDFAPEFTLKEYKLVILVYGNFWGALQKVVDKVTLVQALLEYDGWKVVVLYEDDIRRGPAQALDKVAPELVHPAVRGPIRPNPYGFVVIDKRGQTNPRKAKKLRSVSAGGSTVGDSRVRHSRRRPRNRYRNRDSG